MLTNIKFNLNEYLLIIFASLFLLNSCSKKDLRIYNNDINDVSLITDWVDEILLTINSSKNNSPTYTSRSLGYIGVLIYECFALSNSKIQSLNGQLNGLVSLPVQDTINPYNWKVVLNSALHQMFNYLYPTEIYDDPFYFNRVNNYFKLNDEYFKSRLSYLEVKRSADFGLLMAKTIYDWSVQDGGSLGYKNLFDSTYKFGTINGSWKLPISGQVSTKYPLHNLWGNNRFFIFKNSNLPIPKKLDFDSIASSKYFNEHFILYSKNINLTDKEKDVAKWWGDDPHSSVSPPGHSFNIATNIIKSQNLSAAATAELYAKSGIALADAFIYCWKIKYFYNTERPSGYINKFIDNSWLPFWPEPPFPAFPSGHSTQAFAFAEILYETFKGDILFTDDTHSFNKFSRYNLSPRVYSSFSEMAEECAYSRFLGGIHIFNDNLAGSQCGKLVGQNVNSLNWGLK